MKNIKKEQTTYPLPLRDTSSNQRACELSETVCPMLRKEFQDDGRVLEIQVRGEKENPPFTSPLYKEGQKLYTSLVKTLPSKQLSIVCERKGPLAVVGLKEMGQKAAFTLAEVLITLGVIGVVAAITLPSFIQNHQAKVRTEQNRMVQYKLTKATDQMKSLGLIGNYATTKDFVNELKKHFKIAQICENDNLEQCWPTKVIKSNWEELKVSDIKTGKGLNPNGWTKETIGIVTADGTPMIITYKDDCKALDPMTTYQWETEDNKPVKNATSSCIAAVYDLNGKSRPNKSGEDVRLFNAISLGDGVEANCKAGVCLTNDVPYSPLTKAQCEEEIAKGYGITQCGAESDSWAGAMKACHEAGTRLPTADELAKIASYLYDANIAANQQYDGNINTTKNDNTYKLNSVVLWSSLELNGTLSRALGFYPFGVRFGTNYRGGTFPARCVADLNQKSP